MKNFKTIFPDGNRNSGGAQFFHYIANTMKPTKAEFDVLNRLYCAVSGSPIDPKREGRSTFLYIKDVNGKNICGTYYKCCPPCNCDIMKYAQVEQMSLKLSDGDHSFYAIVINDPCVNPDDIPSSVTSFKCSSGKTTNATISPSGKLVMGVRHDASPCSDEDKRKSDDELGEYCKKRQEGGSKGGMGDIFIKLSTAGELKNVYGEPLQKCQEDPADTEGSWDKDGYCSEKGGGVHQICFDVSPDRQGFSSQTGQSGWSEGRVGRNHCMCLGAWSLYKAKQAKNMIDKTSNELDCAAIPAMSLSEGYVKNWNTWNGNELDDQVVDGVNALAAQCYDKGNRSQQEYLKGLYTNLTANRDEFHDTKIYKRLH